MHTIRHHLTQELTGDHLGSTVTATGAGAASGIGGSFVELALIQATNISSEIGRSDKRVRVPVPKDCARSTNSLASRIRQVGITIFAPHRLAHLRCV